MPTAIRPMAGPGVEPGAEGVEGAVVRWHRTSGEAECCSQELAALVEHGLLDHVVRPQQEWLGDREAKGLRCLQVDHELKLGRLLDRQIAWLGAL